MLKLNSQIEELPKINKPQIAALKKLEIITVQDLLFYFPFRYLDFSQAAEIKSIAASKPVTIKAKVKTIQSRYSFRGHLSLAEAIVSDTTGSLKVVWFNQPYLKNTFKTGEEIFLAGTPEYYKNSLQLTNPIYEKASDHPLHTSRLVPVYRLTAELYPKTFRNFIAAVLPLAEKLSDFLPAEVRTRQNLLNLSEAVQILHYPQQLTQIDQAKKRLAFEELFVNQLAAQTYKLQLETKKAFVLPFNQQLVQGFTASLPFALTASQKKAAWEILQDLSKNTPMNRLLEGDVGSGKTLVAFIAALGAIQQQQAVFLAPTEILAKQHFDTAFKFLGAKKVALMTANYSQLGQQPVPRAKLLALIREGMPALYIGTHALLEPKIKFKTLSLVIIDEQHRFGVKQRSLLTATKKNVPHLLSLSATPIPRTLQLAVLGELDISTIKSKPVGRRPVQTHLVTQERRQQTYDFIQKQLQQGRQTFVITPLIEENDPSRPGSDKLGVKAAKTEQDALQKIFPKFKVGLLHGKLKTKEKENVMDQFLANQLHILVSTSVVEVGVDVPNASMMLIEGAERFGLAQLHQFRGRVGRSDFQSYCFVVSNSDSPEAAVRLKAFCETQDGFALAELDLKLRGFGDIYGQQQSGWTWKYFNLNFAYLIAAAREEAKNLLKQDPNLNEHKKLKDRVAPLVIHLE